MPAQTFLLHQCSAIRELVEGPKGGGESVISLQ
jgi:hypothetical protein